MTVSANCCRLPVLSDPRSAVAAKDSQMKERDVEKEGKDSQECAVI